MTPVEPPGHSHGEQQAASDEAVILMGRASFVVESISITDLAPI